MANKEIFRVEIDDSALTELKDKYDEYSAALSRMPEHWREASTEIKTQTSRFERMYNSLEEQNRGLLDAFSSEEKFNATLDAAAVSWVGMLKTGKLFAGHIVHSTQSLLRWTKLTALFSGIIGAGGLFGINRMAANVAEKRTSATGLGVSVGELQSFNANFGRLGNAEGILGGFAEAETDVSKKWALQQYLGGEPSGDPARDFAAGLRKFKTFVDQYKGDRLQSLGPQLEARGYTQLGITPETARIIQGTPEAEIEQLIRGYQGGVAGRLGISDADAKKWTDLTQQMEAAGYQIEDVFARRAVGLTGPLSHLSDAFASLVTNLLNNDKIREWIGDLGRGVKEFANYLGSDAARSKVTEVGKAIHDIVDMFDDALIAKAPNAAALVGIALAARFGGSAAVATGTAAARSGIVGTLGRAAGVVLGPVGVVAAGGLAATASPTNESITELERQRRFHQGRPQPTPLGGREDERTRQEHEGGKQEPTRGPATQREKSERPSWETPWNREVHPLRYQGKLRVGDETFDYASGSERMGRGSSPFGEHPITSFDTHALGGRGGGAFRTEDVYDPQTGDRRGAVEIHMSHQDDVSRIETHGCFGIPQSQWGGAKRSIMQYMKEHGGATLRVFPNGNAEIVPRKSPIANYADSKPAPESPRSELLNRSSSAPRSPLVDVLGHHPATVGRTPPPVSIMDNTGGQVSFAH